MHSLCLCAFKDLMTRLYKYTKVSLAIILFFKVQFVVLEMHFNFFLMILQPPPAQTMVQALELLYALGGKKQCCQDGRKVIIL